MATPETLGCRAVRPAVGCYALSFRSYPFCLLCCLCFCSVLRHNCQRVGFIFLFIRPPSLFGVVRPSLRLFTCLFVCFSRVTPSLPVCHEAVLQPSTEKLSVIWRSSQTYQSGTPAYLAVSKDKSGRLVQKERIVLLSCKASPRPTPSSPRVFVFTSHIKSLLRQKVSLSEVLAFRRGLGRPCWHSECNLVLSGLRCAVSSCT